MNFFNINKLTHKLTNVLTLVLPLSVTNDTLTLLRVYVQLFYHLDQRESELFLN